jgi:hypothetical protein
VAVGSAPSQRQSLIQHNLPKKNTEIRIFPVNKFHYPASIPITIRMPDTATRQRLCSDAPEEPLPLAWRTFILFCRDLRHGEIERLTIQDGLPMLAELTKKKVKFTREL